MKLTTIASHLTKKVTAETPLKGHYHFSKGVPQPGDEFLFFLFPVKAIFSKDNNITPVTVEMSIVVEKYDYLLQLSEANQWQWAMTTGGTLPGPLTGAIHKLIKERHESIEFAVEEEQKPLLYSADKGPLVDRHGVALVDPASAVGPDAPEVTLK